MRRILIVGLGGIGLRHLESVLRYLEPKELVLVERDRGRLAEVLERPELRSAPARILPLLDLEGIERHGLDFDAAISAVTADAQESVVLALQGVGTGVLVLEKPVTGSREGLERLDALLAPRAAASRVHVDCPRALYPGYVRLRERLAGLPPATTLSFAVEGGAFGFGCNGVHFIELFRHLVGARWVRVVEASLEPCTLPHRRGERFEEMQGSARFLSDRGHRLRIEAAPDEDRAAPLTIAIEDARHGRPLFFVDEARGTVADHQDGGTYALEPLPVSTTTGLFLSGRAAGSLPTWGEARASHEALLAALERATGRTVLRIT